MDDQVSERLTIRNFRAEDADDLFAYLHQPSARCFLSSALADRSAAVVEAQRLAANDDYLAVSLRADGRVIGDVFGIAEQIDREGEADTFSVGWNFNPAFGGNGYALESARTLFSHLFTARHARRLYAYVDEGNTASERLCQRLGMRKEGLFRELVSFVNDGNNSPIFENTIQYSLLSKE